MDDKTSDDAFDQTNGQVPGLDGDSDGTADSDTQSEAEREVTSYGLIGDALGDHHQDDENVRADDDGSESDSHSA